MSDSADLVPTVLVRHRHGESIMLVNLADYLAGSSGRFADWQLASRLPALDPPRTRTELTDLTGGADPGHPLPERPRPRRRRRRSRRRRLAGLAGGAATPVTPGPGDGP